MPDGIMIRQRFGKGIFMAPKYEIGQKVRITPVTNQNLSPRNFDLEPYAGQSGVVTDYYWISLSRGAEVLYIYTVQIGKSHKEVVLHEDELDAL